MLYFWVRIIRREITKDEVKYSVSYGTNPITEYGLKINEPIKCSDLKEAIGKAKELLKKEDS